VRNCDAKAKILSEFKVYMRYSGQGWEIPIALTRKQATSPDVATFQKLFEIEYEKLFGRVVVGMDIEITVWAVNATTPQQAVTKIKTRKLTTKVKATSKRGIFDAAKNSLVQAGIVERSRLKVGYGLVGPAAITEDETTIIVPSSRSAVAQADGCIDIVVKG
jgi:N-methylhydantoinase A